MVESQPPTLQSIFTTFAGGKEMDGKAWIKVAKDTKLLDKKFTSTDLDIMFSKIKAKGARKINFNEFQNGLQEIATKKKMTLEDVQAQIISSGGPQFNATKPAYNKFHDDKEQYTGVYKAGGPSNVDMNPADLGAQLQRQQCDVRGTNTKK